MTISHKKFSLFLTAALLSVSTSACNIAELPIAPKEDIAFAEDYLQKVNAQDFDYVSSYLTPEGKKMLDKTTLARMAEIIPDEDTEPSLTSFKTNSTGFGDNKITQVTLKFYYEAGAEGAIADIEMVKKGKDVIVEAVNLTPD